MATAADGDGDGSVFEMGPNNGNDASIADDVRHGRADPISAKATAAAIKTTKVLKIEKSVAPLESQLGRGGLPRHPVRDRIREVFPPDHGEVEGRRRIIGERERERAAIWFF